jgi:hypothetical protein
VRNASTRLDPEGRCPAFERPEIVAFKPATNQTKIADAPVVAPGPKMRGIAAAEQPEGSRPAGGLSLGLSSGDRPRGSGLGLGFGSGN